MDGISRSESNTKNLKSRLPMRISRNHISRQTVINDNERSLCAEKNCMNQKLTDENIMDINNDIGKKMLHPQPQNHIIPNGATNLLCEICHLTCDQSNNNIRLEKSFSCSQDHLICQRCVQNLSAQSDTVGCVLCQNLDSSSASSECSLDDNFQGVENPELWENRWQTGVKSRQIQNYPTNYVENSRIDSYSTWEMNQPLSNDCRKSLASNSEIKIQGMNMECSRRPIRCPRLDCSVNIAFSALTHHFLFDHPEVPIISVEPDAKSTLIVSFSGISCDSSRCLAILLVSGKLSSVAAKLFNGSPIHPKYRNRLPLPVLAARLHCANRYEGGEGHGQGDIIIAWVAGLDIASVGTLRCSIQAVDSLEGDGLRSLTYTGPINSLRTAQRPREVFHNGNCLILHEGLLAQLTSDCSTLNVNVIVH